MTLALDTKLARNEILLTYRAGGMGKCGKLGTRAWPHRGDQKGKEQQVQLGMSTLSATRRCDGVSPV